MAAKYSDAEYEHDSDDEYDEDIGMWVRKSAKKEGLVPNNPKESEVSNVVAFAENNEIY